MTAVKRWQLKPKNDDVAVKLADILNISPIVAQLLLNRNITSVTQANNYLTVSSQRAQFDKTKLEHFFSLVFNCIKQQRAIFLYGDYDVDGMTSTSMMVRCLTTLGATVRYKLPHRFKDGYGLNLSVIDLIKQDNCGLLITLDCGITNVDEIQAVKHQTDADVIIVDHHQIPEIQPPADLIINPKSPDTPAELEQLCTAGIVLKLVSYIAQQHTSINLTDYKVLAAIGTVADVVQLQSENRNIVKDGLAEFPNHSIVGLTSLLITAQFNKPDLTVRDVGFVIAPRLNAAGRLSTAQYGVELLLTSSTSRAKEIANYLESINKERRFLDQSVVAESQELLQSSPHYTEQSILVLGKERWHAGVIGIAASRLVDSYNKPVVVVGIDDSIARGSARSVGSVNIYQLLKQCDHLFLSFGGHKQAAGFSLKPELFGQFKETLERVVRTSITSDLLIDQLDIDMAIQTKDISFELIDQMNSLEPFGFGNKEPLFYSDKLSIIDSKVVGNGKHLKLTLEDKQSRRYLDAIGFNLGSHITKTYAKKNHLVFSIERNVWNNKERIQLNIKDIK